MTRVESDDPFVCGQNVFREPFCTGLCVLVVPNNGKSLHGWPLEWNES